MKSMRAHQFGGPEQLRFEDAPDPQPQAGQVQIRVRAAGINPADLVRLAGRLQPLPLPYIPGTDVCGEVESVGAGVTHVKKGDRVFGRALSGGYAEKTCLAAIEAIQLPAKLSFEEGAAIPIPFYTAYRALHHKANIKSGETALISAGGGGVGVAAIQLAKVAGARVLTTVGSWEKAERTRTLGADLAINYREQDFVAEVLKATGNKGDIGQRTHRGDRHRHRQVTRRDLSRVRRIVERRLDPRHEPRQCGAGDPGDGGGHKGALCRRPAQGDRQQVISPGGSAAGDG